MPEVRPPSTLVITRPDGTQVVVPVVGLLRPDGTVIDPTDVSVNIPQPLRVFSDAEAPVVTEPSVSATARVLGGIGDPVPFSQVLSSDGRGGGTVNYTGNYGSDTEFSIDAQPGEVLLIQAIRAVVSVANTDLRSERWGNDSALVAPDGAELDARNTGGVFFDLTPGPRLAANRDWARHGEAAVVGFRKMDTLAWARVAGEQPIVLKGADLARLVYTVRGDCTSMDVHTVTATGWRFPVGP